MGVVNLDPDSLYPFAEPLILTRFGTLLFVALALLSFYWLLIAERHVDRSFVIIALVGALTFLVLGNTTFVEDQWILSDLAVAGAYIFGLIFIYYFGKFVFAEEDLQSPRDRVPEWLAEIFSQLCTLSDRLDRRDRD